MQYIVRGISVITILASLLPSNSLACEINRVVRLRNGAELRTDSKCALLFLEKNGTPMPIVPSDKGIEQFLVSPTEEYVAYEKVVGADKQAGIFEKGEDPGTVPVSDIEVIDLKTRKVIGTFTTSQAQDRYLHLKKWTSPQMFTFFGGSQFDVASFYKFDADTKKFQAISFEDFEKLSGRN